VTRRTAAGKTLYTETAVTLRTAFAVFALLLPVAAGPLPRGAEPKLIGDVGASEGPAWSPKGGLFFTGSNRISRRDASGTVTAFREPAGGANGLLFDPEGRLIVCESRSRRITRTETDGTVTVLADSYDGHRFNSPNDLTRDSRGRIYFTDPRYGRRDGMEMLDSHGHLVEGVYRIDAPGKVTRILGDEVERPNGILVSPDDRYLYLADNNNNKKGGARKLLRFRLLQDGSVDASSRRVIFDWQTGRGPDGFKMDRKGRLFVAAGRNQAHAPYETADRFKGGIYILSPAGKLLQFVPIPKDEVTNCAFGDQDLKTLYITAGGALWSLPLSAPGRVPYQP
jgi:gluconolactonase